MENFILAWVLFFSFFSFFRTDNDLGCAPPPNICISPPQLLTYFGAYLKNYSNEFHEILESGSKQY